MSGEGSARVIHSFDTVRHRVVCGVPEQTSSTKHAAAVTCTACRELLGLAPRAGPPPGAADPDV